MKLAVLLFSYSEPISSMNKYLIIALTDCIWQSITYILANIIHPERQLLSHGIYFISSSAQMQKESGDFFSNFVSHLSNKLKYDLTFME